MDRPQLDNREIPLLEPPLINQDAPRRFLYVLFKRKLFITTVFLVLSIPVLVITLLTPTEYLGAVKVLIKPSRAYLNLSPTAGERVLSVSASPAMINTWIQIVQSRELRKRLVKEMPFPTEGKENTLQGNNGVDSTMYTWKVVGSLRAKPVRNSNLIRITAQGTNPEYVARVVNRAAELYLERHLRIYKTQGIQEFYDEQKKKLEIELTKAEAVLKEYQEKEGIVDAEKEIASSLAALTASEKQLNATDSAIAETRERISILETQLKRQKATVSSAKNVTINPIYRQIRDRLTQLELERESLLQRYTDKDRRVMDKQMEISDLKKRLATVKQTAVGSERISVNPVRQRILTELLSARVQLQALKEKKISLTNQVSAYSSMAAEKKNKSFEYDRLQRDVNAKKEALVLYKKKAEEARISDAMDERKFGNASILEKASLPLPIAGFPLWMKLSAIMLLSTAMAVGGAFAIEFFNTTLRTEADVEEQTGLPVLATIHNYKT